LGKGLIWGERGKNPGGGNPFLGGSPFKKTREILKGAPPKPQKGPSFLKNFNKRGKNFGGF